MPSPATCRHCGLPFSGPATGSHPPDSAFCCFGCSVAYDIVQATAGRVSGSLAPVHVRLALAVVFTMAVMMFSLISYSDFVAPEANPDAATVAFSQLFSYLAFISTIPVLLLLGWPMLRRLRDTRLGHSVWLEILALTGVTAAFTLSAVNLIRGTGHTYFETVVFTLLLWTAGRYIEALIRTRTMTSIRDAVTGSRPPVTRVNPGGATTDVSLDALARGDTIRLHAGDIVPVDGEIVAGQAYIDESVTTGESLPVVRRTGDRIAEGSSVVDASIDIRLTSDPQSGSLARLEQDVSRAVSERGRLSQAADRASRALVFITAAIGLATFFYWWRAANLEGAILNGLSVFLVACPCSLGIAVPLAAYFGLQVARREGVLFRSGEGLERAALIDKLFLDKTGTLTAGLPSWEGIHWTADARQDPDLIQRAILSIERRSRHPFAQAVVAAAGDQSSGDTAFDDCRTVPGAGMVATLSETGTVIHIGSENLMTAAHIIIPEDITRKAGQIRHAGGHVSFVSAGGCVVALLEFRQDGTRETVETLSNLKHYQPEIITGGAESGWTESLPWPVHTDVRPEQKVAFIEAARRRGQRVAMVGDGLNDAVALAAADLGVAVSNAQDVNRAVADVRLIHPGLKPLSALFAVSRLARRRMWQNIGWSVAYNSIGLALAVTGQLHPLAAAVAMFGSSMIVLGNSRRWNEC